MNNDLSLKIVKLVHTVIWLVMAAATLYIFYAGLTKTFNLWVWISVGLLCAETLVLIINRWTCPLTPMAMKYTHDRSDNFDIYLPRTLAKYNKLLFGTLFAIGLGLIIINLF